MLIKDSNSSFEEILRNEGVEIYHNAAKRLFDIFFSFSVLVIGMPFFILIAILISCTSKGPPLYLSTRIGRGGKTISCWKFRSMYKGADQKLQALLDTDPIIKAEWDKYSKLKRDPRVTWLGRFIRKTSIDEFPQFWNVFIGELSVVGPRPYFASELIPYVQNEARRILSVRPGLTGLWQTSGRSNLDLRQRVAIEEEYALRRSFRFDMSLICKTIPAMLAPKGAY